MRVPLTKRIPAVWLLVVASLVLSPRAGWAIVPVNGTTPTITPVTINASAGNQTNPHVSGEWAAYSSGTAMRFYNFATNLDSPIAGSTTDLLSDISGSKIVFTRNFGTHFGIMVFDASTSAEPLELDQNDAAMRIGSAIGSNTVAYVDQGLDPSGAGEVIIHDLVASTANRITLDPASDQSPSVSPNGTVVVWEKCAVSGTDCDIYQAVLTAGSWTVSAASASTDPEFNPDSNGSLVVYDSTRAGNADIFWRPVAGGAEVQLQMPSAERNPSIAGNFIAFESRAALKTDLFVYDMTTNRLYQITNTPGINESLNDITLLANGQVRVVWASDEDGTNSNNIWGATFALAPATTLSYSAEAGYGSDGVSPETGSTATNFTYKVVYADVADRSPWSIEACIDGTCHEMAVDLGAAAPLRDGDYTNGEQYAYDTTLVAGAHAYHFETSDGTATVRLPAAGDLTGPSVTSGPPALSIDDVLVTEGNSGHTNAVFTVSLSSPSSQPVTVWYITWFGTAFPFSDFVPGLGRLTIPAGQVQASIVVKVRGDTAVEADETFYVVLFAPHHAAIDDGVGEGTIVNDDH